MFPGSGFQHSGREGQHVWTNGDLRQDNIPWRGSSCWWKTSGGWGTIYTLISLFSESPTYYFHPHTKGKRLICTVAARGMNDVRCSVYLGDEVLEVNGESLHGLTHEEALHKFKVRHLNCNPKNTFSSFSVYCGH